MTRPAHALIDRKALRDNFALAVKSQKGQCMPIVKANAYGHGIGIVCGALDHTPAFGVASINEALELRTLGFKQPILLLEGTFDSDEIELASENNFWLMVENHRQKDHILKAKLKQPIRIWLGLDSGMHRLGFDPREIHEVYQHLLNSGKIDSVTVLATHFACANNLSNEMTTRQIECFDKTVRGIESATGHILEQSLANSAAIMGWEKALRDWQRPGYMLYGNSPFYAKQTSTLLRPVMTLKSEIISLRTIEAGETVGYDAIWKAERKSTIATISIGYGDGYPRRAKNGTPVIIKQQRCPLVGRVSMDMITADVTDCDSAQLGDPVILWGPELPVNEVAGYCETNGYELLSGISIRIPRVAIN
ncbi:MAG: alanine racemase [Porticoccaceae bacterium]|nr:alanine racemase [Porticoccaceae bacterium]|tara:strand:+ start:3169 stop:4260 length:1092 start_codon:yes stop_codon:yes gene_type:complete